MNVSEAILTRRSIGKVKDTPVSKEKIEKMLEVATGTESSSYRTWKFFVLSGEAEKPLSRVLKEVAYGSG